MQLSTTFMQERSVCNLLYKRVAKCKKPLFEGRHVVKQLGLSQVLDRFRKLALVHACDPIQNQQRDFAANYRGDLQYLFCVLLQTVNASGNDSLYGRG